MPHTETDIFMNNTGGLSKAFYTSAEEGPIIECEELVANDAQKQTTTHRSGHPTSGPRRVPLVSLEIPFEGTDNDSIVMDLVHNTCMACVNLDLDIKYIIGHIISKGIV